LPYKFTDPLGLIPSSTGACGAWCAGGDSGSFGSGGAFDSIAGMIGIDIYFVLTRTRQYTTFAEDGGRRVEIKINITERFILDRNKDIVSREGAPQVVARPKSVGSMQVSEEQITSIKNIVETAVKLALAEGFPVPILLTLLRIETQYGLLKNREPGRPPNKVSTINPGQYSRQPNGDRAVSESEAGGKQNALDINIRKVMSLWNGKYVQSGENLQEMFELYNSEKGKMKAYGAKAFGYYREITQSYEELNSIDGSFFGVGRPSFIPFILTPCSMFNPCPRLR
jgi:hypothetical protein